MSSFDPVGGLIRTARRRRQQRRWTAEVFPTSLGGTMRAPYPSGIAKPPGTDGEALFGSSPIGELIRVAVSNEHHGPGEPLRFETVLDQLGFPDTQLPGVEIELPHTAVYGIEGDFSYQPTAHAHEEEGSEIVIETDPPFVGGGSVSLLLNGVGIPGLSPINAGGLPERNIGKTFTLAEEFYAQKGDVLTIILDHAGAEPSIAGVIEVATKEPLRVFTPETLSPLGIETTPNCNCQSLDDSSAVAQYWDPTESFDIGLEPGDLIVNFTISRPEPAFPSCDGCTIDFLSVTARNGWQLAGIPKTSHYQTVGPWDDDPSYDMVAFLAYKVITAADLVWNEPNPDAPDSLQEYASILYDANLPGGDPLWINDGLTISMAFRGPTTATLIEHILDASPDGFSEPMTPYSAQISAGSGSGDVLTSVVIAGIGDTGDPVPLSEIAVDEWVTWGTTTITTFYDSRVQRAIGPQLPRTINIVNGSLRMVNAVTFRVT